MCFYGQNTATILLSYNKIDDDDEKIARENYLHSKVDEHTFLLKHVKLICKKKIASFGKEPSNNCMPSGIVLNGFQPKTRTLHLVTCSLYWCRAKTTTGCT